MKADDEQNSCLAYCSRLTFVDKYFFETSTDFQETTPVYIPKERHVPNHSCDNTSSMSLSILLLAYIWNAMIPVCTAWAFQKQAKFWIVSYKHIWELEFSHIIIFCSFIFKLTEGICFSTRPLNSLLITMLPKRRRSSSGIKRRISMPPYTFIM
jgi:hypothetical protein